MRKWVWVLAAAIVVAVAAVAWPQAAVPPRPQTLFGCLALGQSVTLKDAGAAYEISSFTQPIVGPYRVVEIAHDYIVLQDVGQLTDVRIPATAVKCIVHTRR